MTERLINRELGGLASTRQTLPRAKSQWIGLRSAAPAHHIAPHPPDRDEWHQHHQQHQQHDEEEEKEEKQQAAFLSSRLRESAVLVGLLSSSARVVGYASMEPAPPPPPRVPPSPTATSISGSGSGGWGSGSGYLDFLIGDPAYRQAKAQLGRYRSSLASEAARAEAGAQRGMRALRSFDTEARRDGEHLGRTGGRHLGLFRYMAGLRLSLLRLETAQWQRGARVLLAREAEVGQALERLQSLLAKSEGGRLDEAVHLRPSPQELLAGDAELAALRRRAGLLARVCEGVGAEASLLVLQDAGGGGRAENGGGGSGGCEGCGAGLEGPVESVEERRRKLLHLAEEAAVLYFGGDSGGGDNGSGRRHQEDDGDDGEAPSPSPAPTDAAAAGGAAAAAATTAAEAGSRSLPESLQRQREVVQLRLKCEREFAFLVADERHREGRLLGRWLELLKEVAGDEQEEQQEQPLDVSAIRFSINIDPFNSRHPNRPQPNRLINHQTSIPTATAAVPRRLPHLPLHLHRLLGHRWLLRGRPLPRLRRAHPRAALHRRLHPVLGDEAHQGGLPGSNRHATSTHEHTCLYCTVHTALLLLLLLLLRCSHRIYLAGTPPNHSWTTA